MNYDQGDIVLVPFPFTDLSTTKQRPALVVSPSWFNNQCQDLILVAITSQIPENLERDEVKLTPSDQAMAKLPLAGIIKAGNIFTIERKLIRKKMGKLSIGTITATLEVLRLIFSKD